MKITPANAALIADWCDTTGATVNVPIVVLRQILRELSVAEVLFDKRETHCNYYHHQDNETRALMSESAPGWQEHKKQAKKLAKDIRDMLVEEFVKAKE